jgi:hypothetical protein
MASPLKPACPVQQFGRLGKVAATGACRSLRPQSTPGLADDPRHPLHHRPILLRLGRHSLPPGGGAQDRRSPCSSEPPAAQLGRPPVHHAYANHRRRNQQPYALPAGLDSRSRTSLLRCALDPIQPAKCNRRHSVFLPAAKCGSRSLAGPCHRVHVLNALIAETASDDLARRPMTASLPPPIPSAVALRSDPAGRRSVVTRLQLAPLAPEGHRSSRRSPSAPGVPGLTSRP